MHKFKSHFLSFFSIFLAVTSSVYSQSNTVITIKDEKNAPIINKHIYGHFAEHLGRSIYGGIFVGDTSKIPNTEGVRNDIIEALKALKIPNFAAQKN